MSDNRRRKGVTGNNGALNDQTIDHSRNAAYFTVKLHHVERSCETNCLYRGMRYSPELICSLGKGDRARFLEVRLG